MGGEGREEGEAAAATPLLATINVSDNQVGIVIIVIIVIEIVILISIFIHLQLFLRPFVLPRALKGFDAKYYCWTGSRC